MKFLMTNYCEFLLLETQKCFMKSSVLLMIIGRFVFAQRPKQYLLIERSRNEQLLGVSSSLNAQSNIRSLSVVEMSIYWAFRLRSTPKVVFAH